MNYSWQNIQRRIKDIKYPVGAEIGVHRGVHASRLLEHIPGLTLYMVDNWNDNTYFDQDEDAATTEKIKDYHDNWFVNLTCAMNVHIEFKERSHIIRCFSPAASKFFPDEFFDFVYIDAAHDYNSVYDDISFWKPKVKPGGWICGHDYGVFDGVKKAVNEIFPDAEIDSDYTWFKKVV